MEGWCGPQCRGETGGKGAWWQSPGLGGVALTGPRGPSTAGPYGEQWKREQQREPWADKPPLPLLQLFPPAPRAPRDPRIRDSQHKDNTCIKNTGSGHQWCEANQFKLKKKKTTGRYIQSLTHNGSKIKSKNKVGYKPRQRKKQTRPRPSTA